MVSHRCEMEEEIKILTVDMRQGAYECLNGHDYAVAIVGDNRKDGRFVEYAVMRRTFCCWRAV